jgi:osmotically-inducible protein OsmY
MMLALAACAPVSSQAVQDATLGARVKTALVNDPTIGAERIEVAVRAGVVTLSGTVSSEANRQRAIELAHAVSGVVSVKSTLRVPRAGARARLLPDRLP